YQRMIATITAATAINTRLARLDNTGMATGGRVATGVLLQYWATESPSGSRSPWITRDIRSHSRWIRVSRSGLSGPRASWQSAYTSPTVENAYDICATAGPRHIKIRRKIP